MAPPAMVIGSLFGISEVALALFKRSGRDAQSADQGSLRMLWIGILATILFATFVGLGVRAGRAPRLVQAWPLAYGLFLCGAGLRWWSIASLGRYFTVDVAIAADQPVIDTGPYRLLRHPSYTGVLIAFLGYGVALYSWLALIILMVPITILFLRRIGIEERALQAGIGAPYVAYMRRTWRLVPLLY